MKEILKYFITKEDNKEINKEIIRESGDKITQHTSITTTYYDIPQEVKEVLIHEFKSKLQEDKHARLLRDKEL